VSSVYSLNAKISYAYEDFLKTGNPENVLHLLLEIKEPLNELSEIKKESDVPFFALSKMVSDQTDGAFTVELGKLKGDIGSAKSLYTDSLSLINSPDEKVRSFNMDQAFFIKGYLDSHEQYKLEQRNKPTVGSNPLGNGWTN